MIRLESCEFFSRFSHSLSISPEWQWEKKAEDDSRAEEENDYSMASCNVLLSIMALSHRHSLLSYLFDCRSLKITSCFHLAAAKKNGRLKKEKHSL